MTTHKEDFVALCEGCGTTPIDEEEAVLSVGREFLPPCAIAVLDGGEATDDYWIWIAGQTQQAQDEHDREYASGHGWHQERS